MLTRGCQPTPGILPCKTHGGGIRVTFTGTHASFQVRIG